MNGEGSGTKHYWHLANPVRKTLHTYKGISAYWDFVSFHIVGTEWNNIELTKPMKNLNWSLLSQERKLIPSWKKPVKQSKISKKKEKITVPPLVGTLPKLSKAETAVAVRKWLGKMVAEGMSFKQKNTIEDRQFNY